LTQGTTLYYNIDNIWEVQNALFNKSSQYKEAKYGKINMSILQKHKHSSRGEN